MKYPQSSKIYQYLKKRPHSTVFDLKILPFFSPKELGELIRNGWVRWHIDHTLTVLKKQISTEG